MAIRGNDGTGASGRRAARGVRDGAGRVLAALAILALLVSVAPGSIARAAHLAPGAYATTIEQLNLRSGPGASYAIRTAIPCGARAFVSATTSGGVWYKVTYAGISGYAHGAYMTQGSTAGSVCTGRAALATTSLNLRSGAGATFAVRLSIPQGGQVQVVAGPYNAAWYRATYRGVTGYVHGAYLTQGKAVTVRRLDTARKVVALTFDAGSDTGYTKYILDTLAARGARASFGMTGKWAEANPALFRRMVAEGHAVINHTYSHRSFTGVSSRTRPLTYAERADELWKTEASVQRLAGVSTKPFFRPPFGDFDSSVEVDIRTRGYTLNVMWTVDSLGWRGLTKAQILERVLAGLEPGANYLFHVGSQSQDGPALPSIITELRERGYGFVTVDAFYR